MESRFLGAKKPKNNKATLFWGRFCVAKKICLIYQQGSANRPGLFTQLGNSYF
jgi:hypothetical protein